MSEMTWVEWLTLPPRSIRMRGEDPDTRFSRTGHTNPLARRWARTVGLWRLETSADIAHAAGVTLNALRVFKYRFRLVTRDEPPLPNNVTFYESVAQHVVAQLNGRVRPGLAQHNVGLTLGVLPIEAVLYHQGYLRVLEGARLSEMEYRAIEREVDRAALWEEHGGLVELQQVVR